MTLITLQMMLPTLRQIQMMLMMKVNGRFNRKLKQEEEGDKRRVIFDKTCKQIVWETGLAFASVRDFREVVTKYVVQQKFFIEKYINEPTRVRVKYKKTSCPWLLVASYDSRTKDFVVKNYNPIHKCDPTNRNKLCNSKYLAKRFNERIKEQHNIRVIKILDYKDEFLRSNPGSTYIVKLSDETFEGGKKIFLGFYICFHAMKKSYLAGCRPCIGLDGYFLKEVCRVQLLVAVCKDRNNHMLPLAWVVVEIENMHTWRWFVNLLKDDLQLGNGV
ncbi:uncharacterized protein [Nicotiana tomentosiformis]|uniref:uncharacterized protein n=1 Tax=Nicotiana tomentosiformis TaxID=4098 RepID=UPI00388C99C3